MHRNDSLFVEDIARAQLHYEAIIVAQTDVLRLDPVAFEAAAVKVQQSPLIAKSGQRWEPAQDDVEQYLAKCDDICGLKPQTFEDRVKIVHAAHGALMCLVSGKIAHEPEHIQLAILSKRYELAYPTSATKNPPPLQFSKPVVEPRSISVEDIVSFQNPDNLLGKQFVFSPDTESSGSYEVVAYCKGKDKAIQYEVLFEDCPDPIKIDMKEMMDMLNNSSYVEL